MRSVYFLGHRESPDAVEQDVAADPGAASAGDASARSRAMEPSS
jgi:hypothetical protein